MRYLHWNVVVFTVTIALGGDLVHAQTANEIDQLKQIIEQQQKQLDDALQVIEQQQRDQKDQTRQIEALQEQVNALAPPSRQELLLPPGIEGGPLTSEQAKQLLVQPSRISAERPAPETAYSISVGAHINRQVSVADDGNQTKSYFVDSSNVPTFAYIKGKAKVNEDVDVGAHLEVALQDNSSAVVSQSNETAGFNTSGRIAEVTADSKTYGKGSFGKGFAGAFVQYEMDKSGTMFGNAPSVGNAFPGLRFYDKDQDAYSDLTVGSAFLDAQGLLLINRARYDTPVWNGFQLSGDLGQDQFAAATLRYKNDDLGDFSLGSALTYQNDGAAGADWRQDGILGILHNPTGLNLTGGYAVQQFNDDGRHSHGFTIRPGWRGNLIDWGETKTAVDLARIWDVTESGDSATSAGAFIVQDIEDLGFQLYLGYRYFELDRDDTDLDDIHLITSGVSVPFDFDLNFDKDGKVIVPQASEAEK